MKVAQSCSTLCDPVDCSPPGFSLWESPGKNTGMGSQSLFQGIFLNQGWNPGSPALQADSLPAELPGKPKGTQTWLLSSKSNHRYSLS